MPQVSAHLCRSWRWTLLVDVEKGGTTVGIRDVPYFIAYGGVRRGPGWW